MRDLDEGPHRKCHQCGKLQPEARCLDYNDHWYCGLNCKRKRKEKENEDLDNTVHAFPARPGKR